MPDGHSSAIAAFGWEWVKTESPEEQVQLASGVWAPAQIVAQGPYTETPPGEGARLPEEPVSYLYVPGEPAEPPEPEEDILDAVWLRVHTEFSQRTSSYVLRGLLVDVGKGTDLTGVLLRRVAPESILRWLLPHALLVDPLGTSPGVARYLGNRRAAEQQPPLGKQQHIRLSREELAEVYRVAQAVRDNPTQAIADLTGVSARSTRDRIATARRQGLLPAGGSPTPS